MTSPETTSGGWRIDHEFKSHPDVFWPAARGEKTFEFRKDDRGGYHVGQIIRLRCYDRGGYVEVPPLDRRITNILRPGEFGLQEGYCILSLVPLSPTPDGVIKERGEDEKAERALRDGLSQVEPASGLNPSDFDPSRDRWMPIETAPQDETWILTCGGDAGMFTKPCVVRFYRGFWTTWNEFGDQREPTHWQPLDGPPACARNSDWWRRPDAPPRARDQRAEREDSDSRPRPEAASPVTEGEAPASIDQPPSSQESGVGERRPTLREMTDIELLAESASMDQQLAAFRADMDECGGCAGSPGESLYEAADALDIEIRRRRLVPSAPRPSQREG